MDDFEIASQKQSNNRLRKIEKLKENYDKSRLKMEEALKKQQTELPPLGFAAYKVS